VSLTIDNSTHLDSIIAEISAFGNVEVDKNQTIICIVGSFDAEKQGVVAKVFDAIEHIPIRMISYGGSNYNVSILIDTRYKNEALNLLNEGLF
jgi:aspartate kinase